MSKVDLFFVFGGLTVTAIMALIYGPVVFVGFAIGLGFATGFILVRAVSK